MDKIQSPNQPLTLLSQSRVLNYPFTIWHLMITVTRWRLILNGLDVKAQLHQSLLQKQFLIGNFPPLCVDALVFYSTHQHK